MFSCQSLIDNCCVGHRINCWTWKMMLRENVNDMKLCTICSLDLNICILERFCIENYSRLPWIKSVWPRIILSSTSGLFCFVYNVFTTCNFHFICCIVVAYVLYELSYIIMVCLIAELSLSDSRCPCIVNPHSDQTGKQKSSSSYCSYNKQT